MTRYFFDVNAKSSLQYDYSGCYLADLDRAKQHAELIAIDMACSGGEETEGYEVQVRNAAGKHFLSVAVPARELIAA